LQVVLGVANSSSSSAAQPDQKKRDTRKTQARWAVACMAALVLLSTFATGTTHVMAAFVTVQDQVAFIATVLYISYYCIRVEADAYFGEGRRSNPVNPMLASISVAVQRVYGSVENPYSQTIFFIMLTWLFHKSSMAGRSSWPSEMMVPSSSSFLLDHPPPDQQKKQGRVRWRRCIDVIMDCILLSIMLYAGVAGQADMEPSISAVQVLQTILAAMALNRALTSVHFATYYSAPVH